MPAGTEEEEGEQEYWVDRYLQEWPFWSKNNVLYRKNDNTRVGLEQMCWYYEPLTVQMTCSRHTVNGKKCILSAECDPDQVYLLRLWATQSWRFDDAAAHMNEAGGGPARTLVGTARRGSEI